MTISVPGIGSNLDVTSIVSQLMQLEQQPLVDLANKEASYQSRLTSLGTIKGALSTLQTAAQSLGSISAVSYRASSSDSGSVGASAGATAQPGSYAVQVDALAQSQKLVSAAQASATATIGAGGATTVTLSFGTISGGSLAGGVYTGASFAANADREPLVLTIDSSNNTLEGIRDAINAAGAGVTASIVNDGGTTPYHLTLSVDDTGADNSLKIDVSGDAAVSALLGYDPAGAQQLTQSRAAQDASLTVDGTPVTSSSNTVAEAIQGVTLTLLDTTDAPASVTISRDLGNASTVLASLVKAYNDLDGVVASQTAQGAVLQGDAGVLGVQRRVRTALGDLYGSGGAYRTLSALGATFQKDGTLALDPTKLSAALLADPDAALATLAQAGQAIGAIADGALSTSGAFQAGSDAIQTALKGIDDQKARIQTHLDQVQQNYLKEFTALDSLMSSMRQTSDFLTQQLAALPPIGSASSKGSS